MHTVRDESRLAVRCEHFMQITDAWQHPREVLLDTLFDAIRVRVSLERHHGAGG